MRVSLLSLLFSLSLHAQGEVPVPLKPDFSPTLGADARAKIQLIYPGCWDGLLLGTPPPRPAKSQRDQPGATVEVWGLALQESPRQEVFRLFIGDLRQRLLRALAAPPASNGQVDLAILAGCVATHGNAAGVDMLMVQSLQERFNAFPPPVLRR
jgi:hypothetical protein